MDISAQQLDNIHAAYLLGRDKPMVEMGENALNTELDQAGYPELTPADQELLRRGGRYRSAALKASREGQYGIAAYLLNDAEKLVQSETFSPVGRLLACAAYEAAAAYLDYRCGRFADGTERLYRGLACDETLEDTYGLVHCHVHRLRLVNNLIRLKRYQGEEKEALRLGVALTSYLEQKTSTLPLPTNWNAQRLDHISSASKEILFDLTMSELLFLLVGQEQHAAEWSALLSQHTHVAASPHCQLSPRAHLWLHARQALLMDNADCFCELALALVAAGPGGSLWFWYGIVMDIVMLGKDLSGEPAERLVQTITSDMASWRWSKFPPSWQHLFNAIPLRMHA